MDTINLTEDWKKRASAVVDDAEVEKQFRDLAYGFVQNKARALMEPPYRIGFEIVYKNDDNTRMVGIFAFRVRDNLYYAPVFFYEGEVKGVDLLYCHNTKRFVPLSQEWIKFIINEGGTREGIPVDHEEFNKTRDDVNMQGIFNPYQSKKANIFSVDSIKDEKTKWVTKQMAERGTDPETIKKINEEANKKFDNKKKANEEPSDEDIADFIKGAVDYCFNPSSMEDICESLEDLRKQSTKNFQEFISKYAGVDALNLIADTVENDFDFANNLYRSMDQSVYIPDIQRKTEKKASATHKVSLHLGPWHAGLKSASEEFYKKGYHLEDTRDEYYVSKTVDLEELNLKDLTDAGFYEVVYKDGSTGILFAGPVFDKWSKDRYLSEAERESGYPTLSSDVTSPSFDDDRSSIILFDPKTKEFDKRHDLNKVVAICEEDEDKFKDIFKDTPKSGKSYLLFDVKSQLFVCDKVIHVESTKSNGDGITEIKCDCGYATKTLYHNKNITHKLSETDEDIIGENVKFIEVNPADEEESYDGTTPIYDKLNTSVDQLIYNSNIIKGARITKEANTGNYQIRTDDSAVSNNVSKYSMLQFLTTGLHIKGASAEEILDRVEVGKPYTFGFILPERVKEAATAIHLMEDPRFERHNDSRFGVQVEHPQEFLLDTESNVPPVYEPPVGFEEDWDPERNRDMLMTATPNQLYDMSQNMQIPNLFEHGAVGELVKSYDSGAIIDQYIPTLEEALDHLGRILFLINWKPKDFKTNYGSDDFTQKKNEVLSNFKSFGELVLDLKKRSRIRSEGSAFIE